MMVGAVPPEQLFLPVLPSLTGEKEQREKEKVALDPR